MAAPLVLRMHYGVCATIAGVEVNYYDASQFLLANRQRARWEAEWLATIELTDVEANALADAFTSLDSTRL